MIKLKSLIEADNARADWSAEDGKYARAQYVKHIEKICDIVNTKLQEYVRIDSVANGATPLKYDGGKEQTYYPQDGDVGFDGPDTWKEWKWQRSVKVGDSAIGEKGVGVEEKQYAEVMMYGPGTGTTQLELSIDREVAKHKGIAAKLKNLWKLVTQGYTEKTKRGVPGVGSDPSRGSSAKRHAAGGGYVTYQPTVKPGAGDMFSDPQKVADEIFEQLKVAFMPIDVLRKSVPDMQKFLDDPEGWDKWNPII
jgi:hypothetical protein